MNDDYAGAFGGYDIIVKLNSRKLDYRFVIALLNSVYLERIIKPLTRRAAQPHLNSRQIHELEFMFPPIQVQREFAEVVQQVDFTRELLNHGLQLLETNFNSIMQRAFKGELFS